MYKATYESILTFIKDFMTAKTGICGDAKLQLLGHSYSAQITAPSPSYWRGFSTTSIDYKQNVNPGV